MAHHAPKELIEKLTEAKAQFEMLTERLSQPEVINDRAEFMKASKERNSRATLIETFDIYMQKLKDYQGSVDIMQNEKDAELSAMAKEEIKELEPWLNEKVEELKVLLLPKDPNDNKSVIIELRAGVGGDEAGLFVADMYRAYSRYAEKKGWRVELISVGENAAGGFREVVASIIGEGAYYTFKHEMGAHRVQRVPQTETQGRVHTSTITVAVLPEVEEIDFEINPVDLKIETCRASGSGGQHVNTTDSAVRIVHLPTGEVVQCQDERSQIKNKAKALKVLRSRLYEKMVQEQHDIEAADRKSQIGGGFRNERIRTYNFSQGRVTDHRINKTEYNIDAVMEGDFQDFTDALARHAQLEQMKGEGS